MDRSGPMGVVSLVCITCGNEKTFADALPASVTCERCGSTVFRQFATPMVADEATLSQLEEQARGMDYGSPSPDTTRDDVRDLDAR